MKILNRRIMQISMCLGFQFISNNCPAQQNEVKPRIVSNTKLKDVKEKIFYDANGNILSKQDSSNASYYRIINYREGKIYGPVTDYFKNGNLYMTGYYTDSISKGNENGKFTYYYKNGKTFQIRNYINGLLDGFFWEFYPSGLKKAIVSYSKGKRYGCEYAWDEKGTVIRRAFMENGISYNRTECDTTFFDQKPAVEESTNESVVASNILNKYDNNSNKSKNKDCEKNNTGDYCFRNSTDKSLIVTLYLEQENTGNSIFVSRFNLVSVRWAKEVTISPDQTGYFYNIEATTIGYMIKDVRSFNEAKVNMGGDILVERCMSKTYVIK